MGKLNEIQRETTMSFGENSVTTTVTDSAVLFDSEKDKFIFLDPVEIGNLIIEGKRTNAFTDEDKEKLDSISSAVSIKGRVDSVGDLPTSGVKVGDAYYVGLSGSGNFDIYVALEVDDTTSPETITWENLGSTSEQVQSDWDETNTGSPAYIKNKPTIPDAQVQSDWNQSDNTEVDFIKNKPTKTSDFNNDGADGTSTYVETDELSTVAFSGSYNDLLDIPISPLQQEQVDWNQDDPTKVDFIKNRTHYEDLTTVLDENVPSSLDTTVQINFTWTFTPNIGDTFRLIYTDGGVDTVIYGTMAGVSPTQNAVNFGTGIGSLYVEVGSTNGWLVINSDYSHVVVDKAVIHTLNELYIPDTIVREDELATVAKTGDYNDLDNTPTIPAAQIQSDWNQSDGSALDFIKNKPTKTSDFINDGEGGSPADPFVTESELATVAKTGSYSDLSGTPTIPTAGVPKVSPSSAATYALDSNKYYDLGTINQNKTITFNSAGTGLVGIYSGQFTMGSTVYTITFPGSVTFLETPVYDPNTTYQFSIVNNLGVMIAY